MLPANESPTSGTDYARTVVAEVSKSSPRYVWWTGASAYLGWLLATFFPRFIIVRTLPLDFIS